MKRNKNNNTGAKTHKLGLLASMLLIFLSALVVSISLTILLFTLMGRNVYSGVLANSIRPQARMLAESAASLFNGSVSEDSFRHMMRSSETTVVVLDEKQEPFALSEPRRDEPGHDQPEQPDQPDGKPPRQDGGMDEGFPGDKNGDKIAQYIDYCRAKYSEAAAASPYSEFTDTPGDLGVVVALPVTDAETERTLGVLYLIKPVNDIEETAKSVQIVLVISAAIVAAIMVIPIYLVSRWISNPLRKLNSVADEFAAGDYSGRVVPEGAREMSELGETFNGLADSLQRNVGELVFERNRLRTVLEGLSEGLISFDTEGKVSKYNSAAERLLGGEAGKDITLLPAFESVRSAVGEAMERDEVVVSTAEIGERVIRISASSIEEESGSVAGAVAMLMDMTEAERLEQTRRDYVANVSHELRTPLASIRGIADMLNDGLVKNESDKLRYYGYIQRESIRLSTLINDLLELSRLQSGGVALSMRRVELYEMILDVADRMTEPASARGMSISVLIPEGRYIARTNPDRLEQVLISLMDNAVKHGSGGTVSVGMEDEGEKWQIFVENPAEVDKKDIEHLFERFYKADIAHTGEGTGLGLAITEEVLHLMGESIRVKYENGLIRFTFTVSKDV